MKEIRLSNDKGQKCNLTKSAFIDLQPRVHAILLARFRHTNLNPSNYLSLYIDFLLEQGTKFKFKTFEDLKEKVNSFIDGVFEKNKTEKTFKISDMAYCFTEEQKAQVFEMLKEFGDVFDVIGFQKQDEELVIDKTVIDYHFLKTAGNNWLEEIKGLVEINLKLKHGENL